MESTHTTPSQMSITRADRLERVIFVLALLALAFSPTQITLRPNIPLTAAEACLGLAALLWAVRWLKVRDSHSLPPGAHWWVVAAGLFSAISLLADADPTTVSWGGFVKETTQTILYLIVAVTVFRATLTTPQRIRTAILTLLAATSLAVLFGVGQRALLTRQYQPDATQRVVFKHFTLRAYVTVETPIEVSSTFGSWNEKGYHASRMAYAGFLGLVLPFALVLLARRPRPGMTIWLAALFAGAAISILAGYLLPALLLGLLTAAFALRGRTWMATLAGVGAVLLLVAVFGGHNRTELLQEPFRLQISATEANNPNFRYDGVRHLKKFWGEQLAAVNVLRGTRYILNPGVTGVGAGQYQRSIQEGYGGISAVSNQRLESDSQNGYLLAAVSTGLFGLAAMLALFGSYLAQAWRLTRAEREHPWAAALLGAMVMLVLMTLVTNPWVRGTSIVIAAIFAMIGNYATSAVQARIEE